jgi:hypothetical protein
MGGERLLEEEMRNQMVALTLGFSTMLLGACAQAPQNPYGSASAQQNATVAAPGPVAPKPDSHMATQQETQATMSPHEMIVRCNNEADDRHLKGAAIQEFLNSCLRQQNPT